jgi:hypothetical protein
MNELAKQVLENKKQDSIKQVLAKKDLLHFYRYIFEKEYNREFKEAWYHKLFAYVMMKIFAGEVTRVVVTIPPAMGKTEFTVRQPISWAMGNYPSNRYIYTSYSDDLVKQTSNEIKQIIESKSFVDIFGDDDKYKLNHKKGTADRKWYNKSNGGMYATPTGGAITGFHGNGIIIDDPLKQMDKYSKPAREEVVNFYRGSILSRLRKDDPNSFILVIMQRLHENDLVGYLKENEPNEWLHINLTAYETIDKTYEFFEFYYFREAYEPLNKEFDTIENLQKLEKKLGEEWACQYMQEPSAIKTGFVDESYYKYVASWELTNDAICVWIDPAQSVEQTSDDRAMVKVGVSVIDDIDVYNIYECRYGKWENEVFIDNIIEMMIASPGVQFFMEKGGGGIITQQYLKKKIAKINQDRKNIGQAPIMNILTMVEADRKVSKLQRIGYSIDMLKNSQIRFLRDCNGQEQIKKEWEAYRPDKDAKEDNCMECVANVCYYQPIKPISKQKKINHNNDPVAQRRMNAKGFRSGWRV